MSLPPGFLDEIRARLTLSDVVGRKVTWDRRRSNPARGDWWAPCPFHQEKTPSFHVDDRKGFYYCFGCQAKGDIVTFVREAENLDFIDAVERLAREAGLEMPAPDPQAADRRDRLTRLADVMEEAVRAYGRALRGAAGQGARDYARSRGLTEATLRRFEIGFAPDDRQFLAATFRDKGVIEDAEAAGLVLLPDDGGAPFDRFRNRLMFPIRDPRGRCIAFGGRAMSPEARAKYLNSPETDLFHKGRTLYNHGPAREAAGKAGTVIVTEGYMDVIALAQAGLGHAVAPLGTAITAEQLGLLWRMADEPVIALDGDRAGLAAAGRLVDLALPLLAPGRSLAFCLLPEGQDPDDLVRAGGREAMAAALGAAVPLVEMLWRRETARAPLETPERRAALDSRLKEVLGRIADASVRNHYAAELRTRRAALFRPAQTGRGAARKPGTRPAPGRSGRFFDAGAARPLPETLGSDLARRAAALDAARIRESAILLIALANPAALGTVEDLLETTAFTAPETARIRDALLDALHETEHAAEVPAAVAARLDADPVATLGKVPQARAHPMARPGRDPEVVALVLDEAIHRHRTLLGHALELAEARRDLAEAEDEAWTARLRQAHLERLHADAEAVARAAEASEQGTESVFQRMLDEGAWRRQRKKP